MSVNNNDTFSSKPKLESWILLDFSILFNQTPLFSLLLSPNRHYFRCAESRIPTIRRSPREPKRFRTWWGHFLFPLRTGKALNPTGILKYKVAPPNSQTLWRHLLGSVCKSTAKNVGSAATAHCGEWPHHFCLHQRR